MASPSKEGPNQVLESESFTTTKADGAVKLRTENDDLNITPESIPGMLMKAAEDVPDVIALSVKRDDKWVNWTYQEYLQGKIRLSKCSCALQSSRHLHYQKWISTSNCRNE